MSQLEELRQRRAAGEHLAAYRLARDLLSAPRVLSEVEACEVARAGTAAAVALEKWFEARQLADQELCWAEAAGDPDLVAVAAYHQGTVLQYLGDAALALERLEAFIRADSPPRPALDKYRAPAWFNVGLVRNLRKEYVEAVAAFMKARVAAEAVRNTRTAIQAILESAWSELLAGRTEAAGFRLEEACTMLVDDPDPALQAVYICHQAFYHQQFGEIRQAVDLCEEILTPGREGVNAYRRAEAAWIGGECALTVGHLDAAEQFANLAIREAIEAKWPPLMSKSGDLRRRIIEARNRTA